VRLATLLLPRYEQRLFPFDLLSFSYSSFNTTDSDEEVTGIAAAMANASVADPRDSPVVIQGIPTDQRRLGVYSAICTVVSRGGENVGTGTMISKNVLLTADDCVPLNIGQKGYSTRRQGAHQGCKLF
jgi:hypothetical protein